MKSGRNSVWDRCPKCGATVEIEVPDTRHPRERRRDLRRRRWLTRTAFLLLLVFAGVNGWMVVRHSRELQAVDGLVEETEGKVNITTAPIGPMWLKRWLLDHHLPFPQTVVYVSTETRGHQEPSETTDRFLELVGDLPGLLSLELGGSGSSEITDQGMTNLRGMSLLRLSIGGPEITDTGLYYLRDMTSLKDLMISGSPQLTDEGIAHLARLKNMMGFEIHDSPLVTDAGLAALRNMKSLDRLAISGAHELTGEGFVHLEGLKNLLVFDLRDVPQLTDVGLAHVGNIASLGEITIKGAPQLTDEGFAHLAGLKNLEHLEIHDAPRLTDEGLAHFAGMKNLTWIEIRDAPRLTKKGTADLRDSLPGAEIEIKGERVEAGG